jgi:drug/metabolite transporter (DMT)-like permease
MSMLPVPLAVLAALLNAAASVLQRRANLSLPEDRAFSVRLLFDLIRRPAWILGIFAIFFGFLAQAAALTIGTVATVQPLLVVELPLTFMLAAAVSRSRPRRSEWAASGMLTAGLALFLYCLAPSGGDPLGASPTAWLVGMIVTLTVEAAAVLVGRASTGHRRAAWLGIATGIGFGLTAALTAASGAAYQQYGMAGVFSAWQTYAIMMLGPLSFFLLQNALQAGSLVASQPGLTLANPVVAVAWGIGVFGEQVPGGAWTAGVVLGAILIGIGTLVLARSPLLSEQREPTSAAL